MAAGGTVSNIALGPGRLYVAPLGTAEPTSCSAAMPSAWWSVGYTEDGTDVAIDLTSEAIEVAEEIEPVLYVHTKRLTKVTIAMAEATSKRLQLAVGAGSAGTDDSTAIQFPDPASIVGVMMVWDAMDTPDATNKRWLFRKAIPGGTVAIPRKKAPAKNTIGVAFDCMKPDSSTKAIKVFPSSTGLV